MFVLNCCLTFELQYIIYMCTKDLEGSFFALNQDKRSLTLQPSNRMFFVTSFLLAGSKFYQGRLFKWPDDSERKKQAHVDVRNVRGNGSVMFPQEIFSNYFSNPSKAHEASTIFVFLFCCFLLFCFVF